MGHCPNPARLRIIIHPIAVVGKTWMYMSFLSNPAWQKPDWSILKRGLRSAYVCMIYIWTPMWHSPTLWVCKVMLLTTDDIVCIMESSGCTRQHWEANITSSSAEEHRKRERNLARVAARAISMSVNDGDGNLRVTWLDLATLEEVNAKFWIAHWDFSRFLSRGEDV